MSGLRRAYAFADVLLVPKRSVLPSRAEADLSTRLTRRLALGLPIVSASMDTVTEARMAIALGRLGGIGVVHRFTTVEAQARMVREAKRAGVPVGASIGVRPAELERAERLAAAGADVLVVDVAHGHGDNMADMLEALAKRLPRAEVIAGNVATAEAVEFLAGHENVGGVKVGIGPGSSCTTRMVTGFGVPQLSAILECAAAARRHGLPIIADGGIDSGGALVKALAAGASSVMIGNLLAGTDEAPGRVITRGGKRYKAFRGMASGAARRSRATKDESPQLDTVSEEGVAGHVPYRGSAVAAVEKLAADLRSGLSYGGARTIDELRENAEFLEITPAGLMESRPHDVVLG